MTFAHTNLNNIVSLTGPSFTPQQKKMMIETGTCILPISIALAGKTTNNQWDFSFQEIKRYDCAKRRLVRPYLNNKLSKSRGIGWIKELRSSYSDIANKYLAEEEINKRYDPRSYEESGVKKEPTEHRNIKTSYLEAQGIDTKEEARNAKKEIRWRIHLSELPWIDRANATFWNPDLQTTENSTLLETLDEIATQGIALSRKSVSREIAAELITNRVKKRNKFLEQKIQKLNDPEKPHLSENDIKALDSYTEQKDLIEIRLDKLYELSNKSRSDSVTLQKQSNALLTQFDKLAAPLTQKKFKQSSSPMIIKKKNQPTKQTHKTHLVTDDYEIIQISQILQNEIFPTASRKINQNQIPNKHASISGPHIPTQYLET